jgi:hypothetical protein
MQKAAIKLQSIQSELVAPKNLFNKFGGYAYRSAESILEAVKPLLSHFNAILTISDEMIEVGGRVYVKATASFIADGECIQTTAYAREPDDRKGMDASQITGASSSYARKYALNGLFCIDDTKDADATNDHGKAQPQTRSKDDGMVDKIIESFKAQTTPEGLDSKMEKAKATPYAKNPDVLLAYEECMQTLTK